MKAKRIRMELPNYNFGISVLSFLRSSFFFSELCWGKAMVAYTMPEQRKEEESERLRGERSDQVY